MDEDQSNRSTWWFPEQSEAAALYPTMDFDAYLSAMTEYYQGPDLRKPIAEMLEDDKINQIMTCYADPDTSYSFDDVKKLYRDIKVVFGVSKEESLISVLRYEATELRAAKLAEIESKQKAKRDLIWEATKDASGS